MSKIFIVAGLFLNLLAPGFLFLRSKHLPWDYTINWRENR